MRFWRWISRRVLKRLFSILRSYIRSRSSTRESEKSFIIVWPRLLVVGCWSSLAERLGIMDWRRFESGFFVCFELRASIVWAWMREARLSRHERATRRSARIDSRGWRGRIL